MLVIHPDNLERIPLMTRIPRCPIVFLNSNVPLESVTLELISFDNAVVNAKTLGTMEPIWQQRFILFGMPIAVFGMRLLFPLAIVSIVTGMGLFETLHVAMNEPHRYESILKTTETTIFSFGTGGNYLDFAMAKIKYLQVKLSEHPYNFFEPEKENGRKKPERSIFVC